MEWKQEEKLKELVRERFWYIVDVARFTDAEISFKPRDNAEYWMARDSDFFVTTSFVNKLRLSHPVLNKEVFICGEVHTTYYEGKVHITIYFPNGWIVDRTEGTAAHNFKVVYDIVEEEFYKAVGRELHEQASDSWGELFEIRGNDERKN